MLPENIAYVDLKPKEDEEGGKTSKCLKHTHTHTTFGSGTRLQHVGADDWWLQKWRKMCLKVLTVAKSPNLGKHVIPLFKRRSRKAHSKGRWSPEDEVISCTYTPQQRHHRCRFTALKAHRSLQPSENYSLTSICATVGALVVLHQSIKKLRRTTAKGLMCSHSS